MDRLKRLIALCLVAIPASVSQAAAASDAIVDLAINGLPLLSPAETEPVLSGADDAVVHAAASTLFKFSNADGSQILTLTVHPGSERYSIATASVSYRQGQTLPPVLAGQPDAFVTGKGIRLGMQRAEIEALIGEPDDLIGDTTVYELLGESVLLSRFNMPAYRATYAYEDDRLVGFQFGFPYP